jgi:hypothetical protein
VEHRVRVPNLCTKKMIVRYLESQGAPKWSSTATKRAS